MACDLTYSIPWWRHDMETPYTLLAICVGKPPLNNEPLTKTSNAEITAGVFVDSLIKPFNRQSSGWEVP